MSVNTDPQEIKSAPTLVPARPIPANSLSVPVHESDIAKEQAVYQMAQKTNYEMRINLSGEFELFKDSNSKTSVGDIKFETDKNGHEIMTAIFKKPIDPNAINAIALFSAHSQPNDFMECSETPSGIHFNFTEDPKNPEQNLNTSAEKAFLHTYQIEFQKKKMSIVGKAISDENTKFENGKSVSELPSEEASQRLKA